MSSKDNKLSRELKLPMLILYGSGSILGAGIFVVIGEVFAKAGKLTPFSYLFSAIAITFTALAYAEAASRIPAAGGPIDYCEKAFKSTKAANICAWLFTTAQIVSAATILTGFASYAAPYLSYPETYVIIVIALIVTFLAVLGIGESGWVMAVTTGLGILTLLSISVMGWATPSLENWQDKIITNIDLDNVKKTFLGSFLAIYSFIGFGDIVMVSEEVVEPRKNIPRAIVGAIILVFSIYLLVSLSIVRSVPLDVVTKGSAPLVRVGDHLAGIGYWIALASFIVIPKTALVQTITASRLVMDMARDARGLPAVLGKVSPKTKTPIWATIFCCVVVLGLALFFPLAGLAEVTSYIILLVFTLVNLSLVFLKRQSSPEDIFKLPTWVPVAGCLICVSYVGAKFYFQILA